MLPWKKRTKNPSEEILRDDFAQPKDLSNDYAQVQAQSSRQEIAPSDTPSGVDAEALADMQAYSNLREKRKKAKRKKTIIAIAASCAALVALVGGGMWFAGSLAAGSAEDAPIQTAFVERGTFSDSVSASGNLKPVSSVSATPEIDGLVGEVFVSEGDAVTAGQALYTIVNAELDKAVSQAQQAIDEASNGVAVAQLAVNDAYHAKNVGLAAAGIVTEEGASAPFDAAQADSAIRQAELALSSAYLTLADAQTASDDAVATAAKRTVVSPIDGSVVSVGIEPGAVLGGTNAAATAPVQIANLSQMLISVEINEIDILKVEAGQIAHVNFSAIPDLELQGKVSHISTVNTGAGAEAVNMGTVTYTVSILIETPDPRLKPGMTGKARIESQRLENVLMVPLSAVTMLSETEGTVFVIDPEDPESFEERTVKILASDGLTVAVEGKLSEADEVMLVGGGDMFGGTGIDENRASSSSAVSVITVG